MPRRLADSQVIQSLPSDAEEIQSLFRDLPYWDFFRDPETFSLLEKDVIPRLIDGKGQPIRCASCHASINAAITAL